MLSNTNVGSGRDNPKKNNKIQTKKNIFQLVVDRILRGPGNDKLQNEKE
jgi:hypothetical protein